jgi:hypothetical protein
MIRHTRAVGVIGAALSLLVVTACTGSTPEPTATKVGTVADTGFQPTPNGFPFENYGGTLSDGALPVNLTAADLHRMFGDEVCENLQPGSCELTPEAQAWLESTNAAMAGGHCFGFSVAAELLWQQKLSVKTLGAALTNHLDIDNNVALQRLLAYDWTLQLLDSVQSAKITGSPDKILNTLLKVLTAHPSETYTIAFWKRDLTGGHAVTPYAVTNLGGGKWKVLIYDNNWPGKTRYILFDTKADTWRYYAATNPDEPDALYTGDAGSKTISLYPTSPGLGVQPCPFCGKVPSDASTTDSAGTTKTEEIYLEASDTHHANLIVSDAAGQRIGYVNGKLINEIPGAHVDALVSGEDWTNDIEPDFFVPANARYSITLDGKTLTHADKETLGVIGPGYDLSVDDIAVKPGEKDTLVADPYATRLAYTSSRAESPTIKVGVSDNDADYSLAVKGVSDRPGSTLVLTVPAEKHMLTLENMGSAESSRVSLQLTRIPKSGHQVFLHDSINLVAGQMVHLRFGHGWQHGAALANS